MLDEPARLEESLLGGGRERKKVEEKEKKEG